MKLLIFLIAIVLITISWSLTLYAFKKDTPDKYICFWMSFVLTLLLQIVQICVIFIMDYEEVHQKTSINSSQGKIRVEVSGDIDGLKDRVEFIIKQDTIKL